MSVTDEIKERLDIVEVISTYVPLRKAGRNYQGLCPFHNEKTPSFVVFPDNQSWHCFGACGTGGDLFSFVMKRENLDFAEALRSLAEKAGVELQARAGRPPAEEQRLERLRECVAVAAGYFHYLLTHAGEAAVARAYLERRSLLPATWENWQLGYALDSWDALKDHLIRKGFALEEIEDAGLVISREDGSGHYDRFRGRLMIPIRDVQGRSLGFGARVLHEDPAHPQPKYINSPDTPLFDKSSVVYGLDKARQAIRAANLAVMVEGYMDVLGSHQVGVTNVVAGMGTALTESQLRQIKRYSNSITLALDPDSAGDHATLRGLETARQALDREWQLVVDPRGLVRQESRLKAQLRIATLPDGLDPDELALRDVERWRRVISEARPIVDYYFQLVSREENLAEARGKANAVARLAPLIREITNPVEREHYIQALARLVRSDERLVAEQVQAAGTAPDVRPRRPVAATAAPLTAPGVQAPDAATAEAKRPARLATPRAYGMEEHLLGHMIERPDLLASLDADMINSNVPPLRPEDFANSENRAILAALQTLVADYPVDAELDDQARDDWLRQLPADLHERCLAIQQRVRENPDVSDDKLAKDMGDSLLRLRKQSLHREIGQIQYLIAESGPENAEYQRQLYELMVSYTLQMHKNQKLLNARTMAGALAQLSDRT